MRVSERAELAKRYVEQTGVSVFLTGKAGTGKTTFLHDVAEHCSKRHVVVAPTGVAAVGAGGVTIHSFFQLPFDPYLPDVKELLTEYQMPENQRSLNKTKIGIIRTLELLIIDEISMVRADLLDAVDMTLRRYRRSRRPFGGVQLLMIGDVQQLPPVVTERERPWMEQVYPSPFFFHSKALQSLPYVTIELTKVYRQQDAAFVELLNRVRNGQLDSGTLAALNTRVESPQTISQSNSQAITLTTHNHQADAINRRHMEALKGERRLFDALVEGNYPESMMPVERLLEIKVGERVMYVKNDSSGGHRYYNGKLGTVLCFGSDDGNDYIEVADDDGDTVRVGRERWENLKYTVGSDGSIVQEVDGTFMQYPLRAAWAVTIHKAQGLTFDRVNVDATEAFAYGQVYVALSRCRTLEGLTLTKPLTQGVTFGDADVERFLGGRKPMEQVERELPTHEAQYYMEQLTDLFGMEALVADTCRVGDVYARLKSLYPQQEESMRGLRQTMEELASVGERFRNQLMRLPVDQHAERVGKASAYYAGQLSAFQSALAVLLEVDVDNQENSRQLRESGEALTERLAEKLACMRAVRDKGFSVAVVQQARASSLLQVKNGRAAKTKEGRRRRTDVAKAGGDEALMQALRQWRREKADELGVSLFVVMQQKTLMAIVAARPTTEADLLAIPGIGKGRMELYGQEILRIVRGEA